MRDLERRLLTGRVELRARGVDSPPVLVGYAAKFRTHSRDLGGFVETIEPGAFAKTLADAPNVLARYNHDDNMLLGSTQAGTLRLSVDEVGLRYEVDLPDTTVGRDVGVLADRGDVAYSSFAFYTIRDSWSQTEHGYPLRSLHEVALVDVAPVNSPAYLDTSAAMRSLAAAQAPDLDDVEDRADDDGGLPGDPHRPNVVRQRLLAMRAVVPHHI